jgi:CRP/FNR family transcriptional regulator
MNSPAPVPSASSWIQNFPGLASIRDEAGLAALQAASVHAFPAGTPLMRNGDPCESFLLITRGVARVFQSSDSGREMVLFRVRAGELCVLTLGDLLAARPYSASATAEEDMEVVVIPGGKFRTAMTQSEAFRNFVLASLTQRLCGVMGLIEQVTFQRLDLRLACLLGQKFGQRNAAVVRVTHQELANELGTSREVVSRFLKDFERMGCIHLRRGEIELLSSDALSRLTCPTSV